jgi:hypothetical protein
VFVLVVALGVLVELTEPVVDGVVALTLATAAVVFDGASAPIAAVPLVVLRSRLLPHAASAAPASSAVAPAAIRTEALGIPRTELMMVNIFTNRPASSMRPACPCRQVRTPTVSGTRFARCSSSPW